MAAQGNAHAKTALQDFFLIGNAIAVFIAQGPDIRNAGEIDRSLHGKNTGCSTIEHVIEAIGKHLACLANAITILVDEQTHDLGFLCELGNGFFVFPFLMQLAPVLDFLRGKIVEIPVKIVAIVLHPEAEAVGFRNVDVALFIETKSGGGSDFLLFVIRHDLGRHAFGNGHTGQYGRRYQALGVGLVALGHWRKFLVHVVGENDMIHRDHAPCAAFFIENANACFFPLQRGDIPGRTFAAQGIFPRGFLLDLAIHDQLHAGFSRQVSATQKENDVGFLDSEFRRCQRTGRFITAVGGASKTLAGIGRQFRRQALGDARDRGLAEGTAFFLPGAKAITFERFEQLGGSEGRKRAESGENRQGAGCVFHDRR